MTCRSESGPISTHIICKCRLPSEHCKKTTHGLKFGSKEIYKKPRFQRHQPSSSSGQNTNANNLNGAYINSSSITLINLGVACERGLCMSHDGHIYGTCIFPVACSLHGGMKNWTEGSHRLTEEAKVSALSTEGNHLTFQHCLLDSNCHRMTKHCPEKSMN